MGEPTPIQIPTADERFARGDLYLPTTARPQALVILCHGFKGYKTWGFLPYVSNRLREAGLVALSMDMSHNGTFPGDADNQTRYPRPDLFAQNTLDREYHDLGAAITFVSQGGLKEYFATPFLVGLFGHSRGGVVATLNAIERPEVRALCTWSMADDPDYYSPRQKQKWRREGMYYFVDEHGTRLGVGVRYLEDLEENHEFYFVGKRVRELQVPHLIVHGKVDMVVNMDNAIRLHQNERQLSDRELLLLQTGHTFGIPYPSPPSIGEPSAALKHATDETVTWFCQRLRGKI